MGCLGACWPGCASSAGPSQPCRVWGVPTDTGSRRRVRLVPVPVLLPIFKQCSERDGGCLPSRDVFGRLSDAQGEPCPGQGTSGDTGLAHH